MRKYTVEFENVAITNANGDHDLFEITPADEHPCLVYGLFLSQNTELQEAQEEQLRLRVIRGHTTSGNGTAATPAPLDPGDAAASFTAETVASTIASVGTTVNLHSDSWPVRAGYGLWLPEGSEWKVTQDQTTLVVRLMAGPADDLNASGTLYVAEL